MSAWTKYGTGSHRSKKPWTTEELSLLCEKIEASVKINELPKFFPGRTPTEISQRRSEIREERMEKLKNDEGVRKFPGLQELWDELGI
jgi:hypothetical protein